VRIHILLFYVCLWFIGSVRDTLERARSLLSDKQLEKFGRFLFFLTILDAMSFVTHGAVADSAMAKDRKKHRSIHIDPFVHLAGIPNEAETPCTPVRDDVEMVDRVSSIVRHARHIAPRHNTTHAIHIAAHGTYPQHDTT